MHTGTAVIEFIPAQQKVRPVGGQLADSVGAAERIRLHPRYFTWPRCGDLQKAQGSDLQKAQGNEGNG